MKRSLQLACLFFGCATSSAAIVDSITLTDVESIGQPGDAANEIHILTTSTTEAYTLGTISWDGIVDPTQNAGGSFPTFGEELLIGLTHLPSGVQGLIQLGSGTDFEVGTQFVGSYANFNGLVVNPGDEFEIEFAEAIDDASVDPDAIWQSIRVDFNDEYAPPLHPDPPPADMVLFDATGLLTFPTNIPLGDAGQFWGVQYGSGGSGPSVTAVEIDGQDPAGFWFETAFNDGLYQQSVLQGVDEPTQSYGNVDESDPTDFGSLRLEFEPGDFGPGDAFRFGASIGTIDAAPNLYFASGQDVGQLNVSGPVIVTLEFDDGGTISSVLETLTPDVPNSSMIQFDITKRIMPIAAGDFDEDGDVDGDDLLDLLLGFGTLEGASRAQGDADEDGDVDRDDYDQWRADFGATSALGATSVPEPTTWIISILATCLFVSRKIATQ